LLTSEVPNEALLFFNSAEARDINAFAVQIIPSEEDSPGAQEAGVVYYIDRSLAGFMRDLQPLYRRGLQILSDLSTDGFGGEFSTLSLSQQAELVEALEVRAAEDPDDFAGQFFRILCEHTVQGFFGDPAYGGNRDAVGWKLVGFPGAQWGYTAEQMQPGVDARRIPISTVADLYARLKEVSS
jgi:gluconate 2-dehydrogenase gamma chain